MNNTVNSQHGEKVRKVLHKMLNSNIGSDGKIILLLIVNQPLSTEEICTKVGITTKHFKYTLSKLLIEEGMIKQLSDERWALWYYEPLVSKQKYGAAEIVRLIEVLENDKMPQEYRVSAGEKLVNCCSSDSEIVDGKNNLRPFFNSILDGFESNNFESINFESDRGIVFTHILISLNGYVAFQLQGEDDIQWMKDVCYPKLVSLFNKSGNIEGRNRILRILSQIYRTSELDKDQRNLTSLLRIKFFDPKEDVSIAIHCWDILLGWADDELKETLKDEIFSLAKSWDTFWNRANKELQDVLDDVISNMTPAEKEILEKRGLEVMERHYNF